MQTHIQERHFGDDKLVLSYTVDAKYYGFSRANLLELTYLVYVEETDDGSKMYAAHQTEHFLPADFEQAMQAFNKRADGEPFLPSSFGRPLDAIVQRDRAPSISQPGRAHAHRLCDAASPV